MAKHYIQSEKRRKKQIKENFDSCTSQYKPYGCLGYNIDKNGHPI